jgi:hypothetical protein
MILHRNPVWMTFFYLITLTATIYTIIASLDIYHYLRMSKIVIPNEVEWSIKKFNEETFIPEGSYQFTLNGVTIVGKTSLQQRYLNPFAAQEAINKFIYLSPQVWFDPSNPQISTLEKTFPLKKSFYAGILWALVIYLFWLDRKIRL